MQTFVEPAGFGAELRRWRGSRRVSQPELAIRAGTTQRHLSFIERGRSMPGRAIVVRLAEALGLSLRERNALLLRAGYAPLFPESGLDEPMLRPVRDALEGILDGHLPYPALVLRPYGQVLAANSAIDVLTEDADPALLEVPVNVLRLMLPDGMARRVRNLADWGQHVIENMRRRAAQSPDPRLDEFIAELSGYVPTVTPGSDHMGFAVPLRLRCREGELQLLTTLTSFATAVDITLAELHLEAFLPGDEATAEILRSRARARSDATRSESAAGRWRTPPASNRITACVQPDHRLRPTGSPPASNQPAWHAAIASNADRRWGSLATLGRAEMSR